MSTLYAVVVLAGAIGFTGVSVRWLQRTMPLRHEVPMVVVADDPAGNPPAPPISGVRYREGVNLVALLRHDEDSIKARLALSKIDLAHYGAHLVFVEWSSGTAPIYESFGVHQRSCVVVVDGAGTIRSSIPAHLAEPRVLRSALHQVAGATSGRSRR